MSEVFSASGKNIRVRPQHENDQNWLLGMRSNPEYKKFLSACDTVACRNDWFGFGASEEEDPCREQTARRRSVDYMTIVSSRSDAFVGCAALTEYPSNEWKVDVFIAEQYRRLNLGSEVYWLLIGRAIEEYAASSVLIEFQPDHKATSSLARFFYHNDVGSVSNDKWRGGHLVFKLNRKEYFRIMDSVAERLEASTLQF
ncbi:MAG TPA: GNAT family N-acetyltransferase [Noviherbaspirillum sp.]|nr:GNAT family N-acetyltransferase [Noviherbaspirillum sp.]